MVELPTVGNSLDEFQAQIAQILAKINKVPFDQIGRELHQTAGRHAPDGERGRGHDEAGQP